jgi:phytoene synthase
LDNRFTRIFKKGSRTYFYSSVFFPPEVREDVFKLYSFVRIADDFVDTVPQRADEFHAFKDRYQRALEGETTEDVVIDSFVELAERRDFEPDWVDSFLASMEADLHTRIYPTIERLRTYLYGSAEVIGLMMAKILELPARSYESAMHLGRAMQYVNFIRDIAEDLHLGRTYFPLKELRENDLESLEYSHVSANPSGFRDFLHTQLRRYMGWQTESEEGFGYIPKRYLIPIRTASEMYKWTARVIWGNPFIVYAIKVKPSISRIVSQIGYNALFL